MALIQKPNGNVKWMYFISRLLYYGGLGECWYEVPVRSALYKIIYSVWSFISLSFMFTMMILQVTAVFKPSLTKDEKYDAILFAVTHPFFFAKCFNMKMKIKGVKKLVRFSLVETKQLFIEDKFERAQMKMAIIYSLVLLTAAFITLCLETIDAARRHFKYGVPMQTIITYYPDSDNFSWQADLVRWIAQFYWWYGAGSMITTDAMAVSNLIYLAFHFKTLQHYFKNLKVTFERNELGKTQLELEDEMNRGFVAGIKLHSDILWCAGEIQRSLGNVYSFQIIQSIGSLVFCLGKLVNSERNFVNLFATGMFICSMLILTGIYMWSAGDITLEAARVSEAMFHSGWHLCSARTSMRRLLVRGIQQSQVPVVMKAFGVFELSYENYIAIIRKSYSVFAVLY